MLQLATGLLCCRLELLDLPKGAELVQNVQTEVEPAFSFN
jgi:hypothetical protein